MHTVSFLLLPGFSLLDVGGALSVFETANAFAEVTANSRGYVLRLLAAREGAVVSSSGIALSALALPTRLKGTGHAVVIAGRSRADPGDSQPTDRLAVWLARNQPRIDRGAAFGKAAFLLLQDAAEVGARRARAARESTIAVQGEREPASGPAPDGGWVSGASHSGIDVALSWVEQDHGGRLAEAVALRLPAPRGRSLRPACYRSELIESPPGDARITQLHLWIAKHLHERLTVGRLAAQTLMSARSFARVYREATASTPARAVEQIRLEAACRLIETSARPLKAIAAQCGYGSVEVMRRAFVRNLKTTPTEYRRGHASAATWPNKSFAAPATGKSQARTSRERT
ncbi:GlxA family transcriptional regulator [Variovorax sp. MHTC-1]|uniref:GlxA family transcriptional regulator n=1 Tax=Variovorax sp. MHTC-1 TaxID=2495593 RepID=UPI000F86C8C3|nr:helix-turn-helix domain-containing protein [Variovorax sp. MHTC-1]RST50037.1 helix-turn-helix domain-containing protein [Variovorax sp. MHTC-1]